MKHAKKLLALLLAFIMAFGIGVSAMAAETIYDPFLVPQPWDQTITNGDSFTLSIEVDVPEGWQAEYQWFEGSYRGFEGHPKIDIQGAAAPILSLSPGNPAYPSVQKKWHDTAKLYGCRITLRDGGGTVRNIESNWAYVFAVPTLGWKIVRFMEDVWLFLTAPFRAIYYIFFGWE